MLKTVEFGHSEGTFTLKEILVCFVKLPSELQNCQNLTPQSSIGCVTQLLSLPFFSAQSSLRQIQIWPLWALLALAASNFCTILLILAWSNWPYKNILLHSAPWPSKKDDKITATQGKIPILPSCMQKHRTVCSRGNYILKVVLFFRFGHYRQVYFVTRTVNRLFWEFQRVELQKLIQFLKLVEMIW